MSEIIDFDKIPPPPYLPPDSPTKALSTSMSLEDMCKRNGFFGLSAPQVGIPQPIFVYWSNCPQEPRVFSCVLDPSYFGRGEKQLSFEMCPSFPDQRFGVMRHSDITFSARALNVDDNGRIFWDDVEFDASGLKAAILQHETDHITGNSLKSAERIYFR